MSIDGLRHECVPPINVKQLLTCRTRLRRTARAFEWTLSELCSAKCLRPIMDPSAAAYPVPRALGDEGIAALFVACYHMHNVQMSWYCFQ